MEEQSQRENPTQDTLKDGKSGNVSTEPVVAEVQTETDIQAVMKAQTEQLKILNKILETLDKMKQQQKAGKF